MLIRTWRFDEVAVLDLHGRLGLDAHLALRAAVSEVLRAGPHHIVINLTGVSTLDASGLGELVQVLKQARARGGDVRLVVRSGFVRELLVRTRLIGVFPSFDTESQALASLDGAAPLV